MSADSKIDSVHSGGDKHGVYAARAVEVTAEACELERRDFGKFLFSPSVPSSLSSVLTVAPPRRHGRNCWARMYREHLRQYIFLQALPVSDLPLSQLTSVFTLVLATLSTCLSTGGPVVVIYGTVIAAIGALLLALSLGELASAFPTSRSFLSCGSSSPRTSLTRTV